MEQIWTKALKDSISEVFSTMFFMVPVEEPALLETLDGQSAEGWFEGWLEVSGPKGNTRMWVWTPTALTRELAGNLLSSDPDELAMDELLDAHREMLNMVAGGVLTEVDKDGAWKMGLPASQRLSTGTLGEATASVQVRLAFEVEERSLMAGLLINSQ